MVEAAPTSGTVTERIREMRKHLSAGELRVVAALTDNYPSAGLEPIAKLAAAAQVSAPTVLRFVHKIGFHGYGELQESLRDEVQTRLFSPINVYPASSELASESLATAEGRYIEGLQSTLRANADDISTAVDLICNSGNSVLTFGGKYSSALAQYLGQYLSMLRPDVAHVAAHRQAQLSTLLDITDRTVVVAFDYRRYEQSTIDWATAAVDRGARVVLLTDPYLSPLASYADTVLTTSPKSLGPFDSLAQGFILVEILISLSAQQLGEPARERLARFETLQVESEEAHRS